LSAESIIGRVASHHLVTKGTLQCALNVNSMLSTPFMNACIAALAASSAFKQSRPPGVVVATADFGSIVQQVQNDLQGIRRRIDASIRKNPRFKTMFFNGESIVNLAISDWHRLVLPFFYQNHWTAIDVDLIQDTMLLYDSLWESSPPEFKQACFQVKIIIVRK
jgi:hypothetical protein